MNSTIVFLFAAYGLMLAGAIWALKRSDRR